MTPDPQPPCQSHYPCIHCGACCRWEGEVKVSYPESIRIAQYMNIEVDQWIEDYTQLLSNRKGLGIKMLPDGTCVFLDENNLCRIHPVKPDQCSGYPFKWRNRNSEHLCAAVQTLIAQGVLPP